jgi:hypothetical protein
MLIANIADAKDEKKVIVKKHPVSAHSQKNTSRSIPVPKNGNISDKSKSPSDTAIAMNSQKEAQGQMTVTPAAGHYTGLIIDTTGLSVERSMSPKIRRIDGSCVWAGEDADPDFVIDQGIVVYAESLEKAKVNPRAGSNPLILKALARYPDNFRSDPEITSEDAAKLLDAANKDGFLKKFRVIFVVN